jgi:Spy/CpxP family protein refolding chaperone
MKGGPGASPDRKPFLTPEQKDQLKKMSPAERHGVMEEFRDTRMGGGKHPRHPKLSPEERDQLRAMTPDQRRAYMQDKFGKGGGSGPGAGKGGGQGGCQPPACGPRQP